MQRSALERALLAEGHAHICGCDEAGRGALAGPVVAAAVVLDYKRPIPGIEDSKALSREAREKLAPRIRERARAWAVCAMDVREIERLNILHAALAAMYSAMGQLGLTPDYVLIDGPHLPRDLAAAGHPPAQAVIDGDAQIACIAAASILAKVERDRLMRELHDSYPHYGFAQHVGYGTPQHLAALQAHGPCEQHRRSFRPVQAILQGELFDTAQLTAE